MARLKPEELAQMRAQLFRTVSSRRQSTADTGYVDPEKEKGKIGTGKQNGKWAVFLVTLSVPWGGSRRYGVHAAGVGSAIHAAIRHDARVDAMESPEMLLVGVRKVGISTIEPPLHHEEVRTLLNTER